MRITTGPAFGFSTFDVAVWRFSERPFASLHVPGGVLQLLKAGLELLASLVTMVGGTQVVRISDAVVKARAGPDESSQNVDRFVPAPQLPESMCELCPAVEILVRGLDLDELLQRRQRSLMVVQADPGDSQTVECVV